MIGIVCALKLEAVPIIRKLKAFTKKEIDGYTVYSGKMNEERIVIIISKMGKKNVVTAVKLMIDHFKPTVIISFGTCGGVDPSVDIGQTVVSKRIVNLTGNLDNEELEIDNEVIKMFDQQENCVIGSVGTLKNVLCNVEKRERLWNDYNITVAEMESYFVVETSLRYNVLAFSVRSVTDIANTKKEIESQFMQNHKHALEHGINIIEQYMNDRKTRINV